MSEYIVSARKYRPMTFDSVVGQPALVTTLKNAIHSGKLAHAYLFCGPRGVGKTTCARIFARAINCMNPTSEGEACTKCESCEAFNEGRSYNIFELDAASNNSVENIKTLMEQTRIPPQVGKYKVFIIDEVHMLSTAAFNAFLKTLEEPPAHVIFILATTEKHKILPTIISRCQIYDFERMTVSSIVSHLKMVAEKENIAYEDEALSVIAEKADGGMRDALSIFDQAVSFCKGKLTYKGVIEDLNVLDSENYFQVINFALENKTSDILLSLDSVIAKGFDVGQFINGLANHIRNVLMAKDEVTLKLLEISEQQRIRYKEQATKCKQGFLYKVLSICNSCDIHYRASSNKRLLVELTLIQIAQATDDDDKADASGQCPKTLKNLFQTVSITTSLTKTAPQVAVEKNEKIHNTPTISEKREATSSPKPQVRKLNLGSIVTSFSTLKSSATNVSDFKEEIRNETNIENETFTQEQLEKEWYMMCNRMPENMIGLSSRMKNMIVQITTFPNVEILADNNLLLEDVQKIKNRISTTLSKALHNGFITLTLRLSKAEEVKQILSPKEIFTNILENNSAIARLSENLFLELA